MLADAEKYASADQEKRQNIEIKNQAETLCFEAEKELELLKDKISEDQKTTITELIGNIRKDIEAENFESLASILEELKLAMKNMADMNQPETDSMGDLNDL
jgi:molecular chaperone DnaK